MKARVDLATLRHTLGDRDDKPAYSHSNENWNEVENGP